MTDDDAKALEAERKKTASDGKLQLLSLEGIRVITGGNEAARLRVTCMLGPTGISKADVLHAAAERAWTLLESRMPTEAQAKRGSRPMLGQEDFVS